MAETLSWRIYLLGGFRVAFGVESIADDAWRRRKASTLIKLLALAHGHRLHREQLMETLWPDQTPAAAANSLYQVVHVARQALDSVHAQGSTCLQFERDHLCLCPDTPLWIDVEALDAAALDARRSAEPSAYRAALVLYTGDLLPDDRYDDWAGARRTALRLTYLALLTDLARLYEARGDAAQAIETLQRVLAADPAHETAHRSLMRLYSQAGDRQQALRQYQALRETLRRELDAEPDVASLALYREIADGRGVATAGGETPRPPASVTEPGPSAAAARRHNLPQPVSSFVGREEARAEVARLLSTSRLLTLTGPGGCGKTRLALAVAGELSAAYPAGAWLVDLVVLAEPAWVPRAVAATLGAPELPGQTPLETLANFLGAKRLLLVLDNCEHLVEACAELAQALLAACPNLTIMATGRERLGVPGEVAWPVPRLTLPDLQHLSPLPELAGYEAVRLFCERAAAVTPGFALTPENALAVAEICVRLDGMPLAVELAAARIHLLTPRQIAAGLNDRFRLLTGGARTALPRYRTLRGTMDWSYDLLTEPEQILLRRLAVFRGGFTLSAVETVCEGDLDLLAQLVDKSLVAVEAQGAEARYTLLETIQQYAAEKLVAQGETAWLQDRHLLFYLALAEEAEPRLKSGEREPWLVMLDRETGNLRAALAWSASGHGEPDAGLRLAGALYWFWRFRGYLQEGRQWLAQVLAAAPSTSGSALPRARALCSAAALAVTLHGPVEADAPELLQESVTLARAAGPAGSAALAQTLWRLADAAVYLGDTQAARSYREESLALAQAGDSPWDIAQISSAIGRGLYEAGDVGGAYRLYEESLRLFRVLADSRSASGVLIHLGHLAVSQGDYGTARRHLMECAALYRQLGDRYNLAFALGYLGEVAFAEGAYEEDVRLLDESIELFRDLGVILPHAGCTAHRGMVAVRLGDYAGAARLLKESVSIQRPLDFADGLLGSLVGFAGLALAQEKPERGAALLGAVTELRRTTGSTWHNYLAASMAYDRAMEIVRPMMEQPEWAEAWARGQAMSLAEAVNYALDERSQASVSLPA
jgi:predicted ATPase/DNA-binding SARP family transcriptional activator